MANPDITKSSNLDSLLTGLPVAILFLLVTTFLFQLQDSFTSFKVILWSILLLLAFGIGTGVNIATQYISCKTTNAGKALLGSIQMILGVIIALILSSISYCRIPITSVFAPIFIGKSVDITKDKSTASINSLKNNNSKECCVPKLTLESVESRYPLVLGLAYGFYVMFGILFGTVIGTGMSSIC
jgi:hypothetical protein